MKPILIAALLTLLVATLAAAVNTPRSMLYGGSFLLRADGVEALYWNPSLLGSTPGQTGDFVFGATGYTFRNNFLSVGQYNDLVGSTMSEADENDILSGAPGNLTVEGELHCLPLGWSKHRMAVSMGFHAYGNGSLQKDYLDLLFRGNEYGDTLTFNAPHNGMDAASYIDITYGVGGYDVNEWLPEWDWLPPTQFGFSASMLVGIASVKTNRLEGALSTSEDGLTLDQNIEMRYGLGGFGCKGLVGAHSQINEDLRVGLAIDNLPGFINWGGEAQTRRYTISADNVLLADMDENVIDEEQTKLNEDSFTQVLPITFNLGALYRWQGATFSLDWQQRVNHSVLGNAKPTLACAAEYHPVVWLPVRLAWSGNADRDGQFTYSLGYSGRSLDADIAMSPAGSVLPSTQDKSSSWSVHWRLKY